MAKQDTAFSVIEILGQNEEPAEAEGTRDTAKNGRNCEAKEQLSRPVSSYKPGKIKQMLPPLPTILCGTNINDQPFLYQMHSSPGSPSSREEDILAIVEPAPEKQQPQTKKATTDRKRRRCRSSTSSDVQLEIVEDDEEKGVEEDDVFPHSNRSRRRSSARACLANNPRDLTSSGETPSPPSGAQPSTTCSSAPATAPNSSKSTISSSEQDDELGEDDEAEEEKPKKKRVRTAYTREQLQTMERHFRKTAYPDNHLIRVISQEAGIAIPKIQVWFQNRRAKARKWGQVLPEPSKNSVLHHGVLPSADVSRYLPPLSSSSVSAASTTPSISVPPPPLPTISNPSMASTTLVSSFLGPYQRFYPPPPPYPLRTSYPLLPPPPPYPVSYSLYTRIPAAANQGGAYLNHSTSSLQSPITVDDHKQQ